MSFTTLQIITTFLTILWFDVFGLHRIALKLCGYKLWDNRESMSLIGRLFACYFCTSFWLGISVALASAWTQFYLKGGVDILNLIIFILLNVIVSRVLDQFLGYGDIKGK